MKQALREARERRFRRALGVALVTALVVAAFVTSLVSLQASQDANDAIDQICASERKDRRNLELRGDNLRRYAASPAGKAKTPLNAFIFKVTVPQLKKQLHDEQVPSACQSH